MPFWKRLLVLTADRFFLLRPLVLVPAITFFLLGYREAVFLGRVVEKPSPWPGVIWYALLMASVYVTNQLSDVESDRLNEKLFLLPAGIISRKEATAVAVVGCLVAFAGSLGLGETTVIFFALSFLLGQAYSVPPVALKRRFPFDLLSNAVGYGMLAFVTGWSLVDTPTMRSLALSVPFALCVAAVFILTALVDKVGDERSGFRTTGVTLGMKRGTALALALILATIPFGVAVDNRIAIVGAAVTWPLFVFAYVKGDVRSVSIAYRFASAAFVFIAGVLFPAFLLAVLALLGLARVYYSLRFSLSYPTIAGR